MTALNLPLSGGCQCGSVRYVIHAEPLCIYACHCTECQKQTASAFGMSMAVAREALTVDWSAPGSWRRKSQSGRDVACRFCPACGSRLFHEPTRNPAIVNVKPGSLDDRSWVFPVAHLWTVSAQPWMAFGQGVWTFERQPGDFAPLWDVWRSRLTDNAQRGSWER